MRAVLLSLGALASAQQIGTHEQEEHPAMALWTCDAAGCSKEMKSLVLDANWRWLHNGQYTNCYKDGDWDKSLCPDPITCARNCHLEGNSEKQYKSTYGIQPIEDGVELGFVTTTKYGSNYGSRVYMLDDENNYQMFKLKNREFTLTADMKKMPCGLNGAVYFVEMDADGGKARSGGTNAAGAKYGTGYCDAQCPHDMKFMNGKANTIGWNASHDPPIGSWGICCAEMDIWEANSRATAYTPHPCSITGPYVCSGTECGDNSADERYDGVCDKDGCDYNHYRLGDKEYYGRGRGFTVNSKKKLTVVTQFITEGNTDDGDLIDIRRFYVQDGRVIPNSNISIAGMTGDSITDATCAAMKTAFGDINDFARKGGLNAMGEALQRGMVLVMSLWDDSDANMLWLDADYPLDKDPSLPGVNRGPCRTDTGLPAYLRDKHLVQQFQLYPRARVRYSKIKVGTLGSTFGAGGDEDDDEDDYYGDDRRLNEVHI
ncbi:cbhB [Symbiodinium natans]|uniref:cellulase n=1 Tax=Symbiodinium natans TaxID=878477 RepID=A0A812I9R9_9DINO|nr:cbhB [Symbiodinium natans]